MIRLREGTFVAVCFLAAPLVVAPVARAQTQQQNGADFTQDQKSIALISEWINRRGHDSAVRGDAARVLGLASGADVPAYCMTYHDEANVNFYFCNLQDRSENVMRRSLFWLIKDGANIGTVYLDPAQIMALPNDRYQRSYGNIKDFFLSKAKDDDASK
jgi:hypothetical protein